MPLQAAVIPVTELRQNCTILWCSETNKGAVIDPGGDVDAILSAVKENNIEVEHILLTHGHFDHVGGAMDLSEWLDLPITGPHKDDEFLTTEVVASAGRFGVPGSWRDVAGNAWLTEDDTISFGTVTLNVIHTPGHTPGHVVFYDAEAQVAQVGDVLFQGSIGRTDFPRGDLDTLLNSIRSKLWPLGDGVTFIPGHGPTSTFGEERASNPYVGDDASA